MLETLFWGAILRLAQSLAQAAPFILTGFCIAAIFRRLVGPGNLRQLFGDGTWRSLPQAWGIGMLLPVCSLGVIPVMREMKRSGLSGGTILAFGLTAPLFNPLSVLYGLTLSEPATIFAFMLASLGVVTAIGLLYDGLFPPKKNETPEDKDVPQGFKRMLAVLISMARDFWSRSTVYIMIGLTGIVLLNVVLPKGSFQGAVNGDNPWAPLTMVTVALPAYATPMLAMSQLGMMFQHGNSVGAAFALLILGAGLNFGIVAWMIWNYGAKRSATWMGILLTVVVGLGYALEKPLYPTEIEPANHTHAFDIYCCPFEVGQSGLWASVANKMQDDIRIEEIFSLYLLLAVALVGLTVMTIQRRWNLEEWLTSAPEEETRGKQIDIVLPNWVLAGSAICGLIALSVTMCYAYYPHKQECLEEIAIVKAEVLSAATSRNYPHALHWLPIWEDWNRRLQVGVYLREGNLSDYHRMKAQVLRDQLELLEHAMEEDRHHFMEEGHHHSHDVKKLTTAVSRAQTRLARAFQDG